MKVDHWNDVQAAFTVFININKTPEYKSIKPRVQKEKDYIESSTYSSYNLIPLLNAKYVDLSEPKIDR